MEIKKILVVYDPTTNAQPALERAAIIAQREGSALHLYSCIFAEFPTSEEKSAGSESMISGQKEILAGVVAPLIEKGITVTTEVEWDKDWYQGVVRAAERNKADSVLKASHRHSATQRLLKKTSDRALLRQCECPVLLVKTDVDSGIRKVLAAIDARGVNDSYKELNKTILEFCQRYLDNEKAELHFVNAYDQLADRPDRGALLRACGVPGENLHIQQGKPDDVILECAKKLGVNLVVLGNSARSGLSAMINTNTAEEVLDELDCDLLALP